ncbi:MAG: phosphate signaling complex protein PhoU [Clostridiales Family XIII bacterium]|jgi:phosphate transport system protein|nr:phosphate signaling complex protein PhoU [Clostridiales Family XIII bacterium]
MRSRYDEQLSILNSELIEMGALVEYAVTKAVTALEERDVESAREVINSDRVIDEKEKEIESLCLKLILFEQPVASDLRQVSAALKMITDMERVGDHAADISELCVYLSGDERATNWTRMRDMSSAATKMLTDAIDAFVKRDTALAESVIAHDDIVDDLFDDVKRDLIRLIREDAAGGELAIDLLQIAKYLERIGDHAVNIAEWVIFSITGVHKDTQVL